VRPDPYAWSADPSGIATVTAAVAGYALLVRAYPTPRWRIACFGLGVILILAAHVTPLASLSNHYLLSIHLLQNITFAEWAPALCVLGLPSTFAAAAGPLSLVRSLTHPFVALPLWLIAYFAWHVPWAYDAALSHRVPLLDLEHMCYFATGCLLWWPVLQHEPHRLTNGAKTVYLFAAFVLVSPLGLLLALLPTAIYDFYVDAPRLWGLSPLADQQLAGITMTAEELVVFFVACAVYFSRFLHDEEAPELVTSGSP
jgi:putative membrane protein